MNALALGWDAAAGMCVYGWAAVYAVCFTCRREADVGASCGEE